MSIIQQHYINRGSISGSGNGLRDILGSFYRFNGSEFDTKATFATLSDGTSIMTDRGTPQKAGRVIHGDLIHSVKSDNKSITTSSSDVLVPSVKMPIRLVGNHENIEDDEDWLKKIRTAVSLGIYSDTNFVFKKPYSLLDIKSIDYDNFSSYESIEISYVYNYYLEEYQNYTYGIGHTLIPNYYLLLAVANGLDESELAEKYVSLEGAHETDSLFTPVKTMYPPTYDITTEDLTPSKKNFFDKLRNMQLYLTSSFINTQYSASTTPFIESAMSNVYFNQQSQQSLFSPAQEMESLMPYMAKVKIPVGTILENDTPFGDMIADSGYENLLINQVKKHFSFNEPALSAIDTQTFTRLESRANLDADSLLIESNISSSSTLRQVNLYTIIMDSLIKSTHSNNENFYIMAGQDQQREQIINFNGQHCYSHSIPTLKLLDQINDYLESNFEFFQSTSLQLENILDAPRSPKHSEVLLFKIDKFLDSSSIPVQSFYFTNTSDLTTAEDGNTFTFYDSQIRYGETVNYLVYAYVLVFGYNYSLSDLLVTRLIASQSDATGEDVNCLEFFNPSTENAAEQLYTLGTNAESNSLFTNAQISTHARYLADLNIIVEPTIKLLEIPFISKSTTIGDHPTNKIDVHTFQRMNDSQIIGFLSNLTSFSSDTYPTTLNSQDEILKNKYLQSNNLLETEKITNVCKSKPDRVEIYRKLNKPTAKSSFSDSDIIATKYLDIEGTKFKLSNCLYEEKIQVNTKYYYILRFVSENNTIGEVTNVIEAEIVNDGGYLYSIFTEYSDEDLAKLPENNQSKTFKKLMHLVPNIGQIEFVDDNVDYSRAAAQEVNNIAVGSAEDSIFGKTFKIRLTSKKTGKKIDLNITYNLSDS
jgi:hypothetical protein